MLSPLQTCSSLHWTDNSRSELLQLYFIDALDSLSCIALVHCKAYTRMLLFSVLHILYTRVLLKSYDSLYFTDTRSNLDQLHTLDTAPIQMLSAVALQLLIIYIYFFSAMIHYNTISLHLNISIFDCAFAQ